MKGALAVALAVGSCWVASVASGFGSQVSDQEQWRVFAAKGYDVGAYGKLMETVVAGDDGGQGSVAWCLGHGARGLDLAVRAAGRGECPGGVALLGAVPAQEHVETLQRIAVPLLVVAGDLDGVSRFSSFAVAAHRFAAEENATRAPSRFVVVEGASHHSFAGGHIRGLAKMFDLRPELEESAARERVATLLRQWLRVNRGHIARKEATDLVLAELRSSELAGPVVEALKLEGSAALGQDVCNSDFPTNANCNYPKYPDFSLPPGPKPAPSPLPSSDCICGSQWVTNYAFPIVSGASDIGFRVTAADAFHDVSDTHPFHLPHTWNTCSSPQGCVLNVTTLTMLVTGAGNLFPNASDAPVSALELRTKMKSRQTLWEAAGDGKQSTDPDKKNMTICRRANEMAWSWALENADASVRERFQKSGEPFVMVDDVEAPIGITGPEWIKKELVYTRKPDPSGGGKSQIEVQSWAFVVPESPIKTKYLPTGMHYCKLLSPARAMEWIYLDGLRYTKTVPQA